MKHRIRKLTSLLLSLSLISALTLPAAASNALGEDLSAKDTLLHHETQLSTNVFWSTTYSDLRTENLITYTPNKAVTPIVTYGDALTDRSSVADTAALLEDDGYRVVAGINGDFYNVSTGLPIGMVVTEGLLRSSDAGYYAIGFRADGSAILGKPGVKVSANLGYAVDDGFGNSTELVRPVAAVNKARTNSGLYLYTYDFNAKHTTGTTEPGINVVCTVEQGKLAIGYTCYFMPEVLLDLPGCFSVRLRAPRCSSPDIATYYMSARVCHYGRSLFERALEGGFNFLDAQMATETCTVTCRFQEHIKPKHLDSVKDMNVIQNDKFFCEFTDVPFKNTENDYEYFRDQLRAHVLTTLHDNLGIDVSDKALKEAIKQHNEVCKLINEIGDYRKLDNPTITGYEFHVIQLVSLVCPKYLILPYLRETAKEMKTRKPDEKWPFRCKVVLAGSENDDPDFTKLVESCGAEVVCDRYCYGAVESRQPIVVEKGEDPLYAIAKHYLKTSNCPRFMPQDEMRARKQRLADLVKEYNADGIIVCSNKFCEYWSYERVVDTVVLKRDFGIPVCSIEKEYINTASGQLRTRFQAFVESVEIKKIQEGK